MLTSRNDDARCDIRFASLRQEGRAALVTFVMAAIPICATCLAILKAFPKAGADVIELGMPFTDPMADGPAIQAAGLRALGGRNDLRQNAGARRRFPQQRFDDAGDAHGLLQPGLCVWRRSFPARREGCRVDGLIVVDLPPEEDAELCLPALAAGLNFIRLATPTTDDTRLPAVLAHTSGFVYYVSITGITGAAAPELGKVASAVARIKAHTSLPVAVGFGVKNAASAAAIAAMPMAWWSARRSSKPCAASLDRARQATRKSVEAVTGLVADIAKGVRTAATPPRSEATATSPRTRVADWRKDCL